MSGPGIIRQAELYQHMRDVADANGFASLTDAITQAVRYRKALERIANEPDDMGRNGFPHQRIAREALAVAEPKP